MDSIPWDFAVAVPGYNWWSGRRKAGVAALGLHNFSVWTVLGNAWTVLPFPAQFGSNSELLQQLLQVAANGALKIKLKIQVKTNQPLL